MYASSSAYQVALYSVNYKEANSLNYKENINLYGAHLIFKNEIDRRKFHDCLVEKRL